VSIHFLHFQFIFVFPKSFFERKKNRFTKGLRRRLCPCAPLATHRECLCVYIISVMQPASIPPLFFFFLSLSSHTLFDCCFSLSKRSCRRSTERLSRVPPPSQSVACQQPEHVRPPQQKYEKKLSYIPKPKSLFAPSLITRILIY